MKEIKEIKNIYICLDTIEDNQIIKKILVEFMDDSKSYFMLSSSKIEVIPSVKIKLSK